MEQSPLEMMRASGQFYGEAIPQAKALGIKVVRLDPAEAVLCTPWREELVGDPQTRVLAGGVVTTLLDHACGQAVTVALPRFMSIATLDLRIDYMRAAEPGLTVYAHARCYRLTRSVAFVRAFAYDRDESDPVAAAQAAFMLDSNNGRKAGDNYKPSRGGQGAQGAQGE